MNSKGALILASCLTLGLPCLASLGQIGFGRPPEPSVQIGASLQNPRVYPNPWRSDQHAGHMVTFDHVPPNATVRIFTVAAELVKTLSSGSDGSTTWDLTNSNGATVASGIYLYLVTNNEGEHLTGKLAVIR